MPPPWGLKLLVKFRRVGKAKEVNCPTYTRGPPPPPHSGLTLIDTQISNNAFWYRDWRESFSFKFNRFTCTDLTLVFTLLCQPLLRRFSIFICLSLFVIFTLSNQPFFPYVCCFTWTLSLSVNKLFWVIFDTDFFRLNTLKGSQKTLAVDFFKLSCILRFTKHAF